MPSDQGKLETRIYVCMCARVRVFVFMNIKIREHERESVKESLRGGDRERDVLRLATSTALAERSARRIMIERSTSLYI